jgi:hypothetical protein
MGIKYFAVRKIGFMSLPYMKRLPGLRIGKWSLEYPGPEF